MILQSPFTNPVISPLIGKTEDDVPTLFGKLLSGMLGFLLIGATIWFLAQLILAGINWMSSGGDKSKLEEARTRITNALLGIFIVFGAWVVYLLILNFFGISPLGSTDQIQIKLPSLL